MDYTKPPALPVYKIPVAYPGTKSVLKWPVVRLENRVSAVVVNKDAEEFHAFWPRLPEKEWPFIKRNAESEYLGVIWMITPDRKGGWEAAPTEQLRRERERNLTAWTYEHIRDDGQHVPREGEVFGLFIAGPSRHEKDRPEYRRRTMITWWVMGNGDLKPYKASVPIDPPKEEPVEESDAYLEGFEDGFRDALNEMQQFLVDKRR
jgi:hypothetical protein